MTLLEPVRDQLVDAAARRARPRRVRSRPRPRTARAVAIAGAVAVALLLAAVLATRLPGAEQRRTPGTSQSLAVAASVLTPATPARLRAATDLGLQTGEPLLP